MTDIRDYLGEFRKLAEDYIPPDEDGWTTAVQAQKIVQDLLEKDPVLLQKFWELYRVTFTRMYLDEIMRQRRAHDRRGNGDRFAEKLAIEMQYACEGNTRKRARAMTMEDHKFVAGRYQADAGRSGRAAAFHEAVAEKIRKAGAQKTEDVFDPAVYQGLYDSMMAGPTRRVA
jgi:hypothetical protein